MLIPLLFLLSISCLSYIAFESINIESNHFILGKMDKLGIDIRQSINLENKENQMNIGILNTSPLGTNEKLLCRGLTLKQKIILLSDFSQLDNIQKLILSSSDILNHKDDKMCRIYLSQMSYNKLFKSAYSISSITLQADQINNLTHCGLLKVYVQAGLNYRKLEKILTPSLSCNPYAEINLDFNKHPINRAVYFSKISSNNISLTDTNQIISALKTEKKILEQKLSAQLYMNAIVKEVNQESFVSYSNYDFNKDFSIASLAKLIIYDSALKYGYTNQNLYINHMLCHSNPVSTNKLLSSISPSVYIPTLRKYNFNTMKNDYLTALITENNGMSTNDLLIFLDHLSQKISTPIPNAFGKGCTADGLKLNESKVILAKTGTEFRNGKVTGKLLTVTFYKKNKKFIALVRIHNSNGICQGDGCFSNQNFQGFLNILEKSSDKL